MPVEYGEGKAGKQRQTEESLPTLIALSYPHKGGDGDKDSVLVYNQTQTKTEALLQLAYICNQYY